MEPLGGLMRFRQQGREPGRGRGHAGSGPGIAAGLSCAVVLGIAACHSRPVDPVGIPQAPAPFVRAPYVQQVTDSSASILWMSQPGSTDSTWYRVPERDTAWIRSGVRDYRSGTLRADLARLPPSSAVEYMVSASGTRMGPHTFRTAPRPGSSSEPVRVLLFGDSGWGSPEQIDLARGMERDEWDLAIHVGDIAYNDGAEGEFTERHFRVYARTLASTPFYPSVGNHDVRADGGRSYDAAFLWSKPFPGSFTRKRTRNPSCPPVLRALTS